MLVKAGLLVDFGNSQTRMVLIVNNKSKMTILSNKFAELPPAYKVPNEYKNGKSTILNVDGAYFANGSIVEREFVGVEIRPSAVQAKTDQLVTDLTLNLVFSKALVQLAEIYNVSVSELNVTFDVSVVIPPLEHETDSDKLVDKIKGINIINALSPTNMSLEFNIGNVTVFPEGVAAFFGALYKEDGSALVEVDENSVFSTGYVLVLDIGAGTTDVVLIKDSELVLNSKDTFKRGGNTVESLVRNAIKKEYGFSPKLLGNTIATGLLEEGVEVHDVCKILDNAKSMYSKSLMEDLRQYLERMMIDMPEIKGVLVTGGGSLPSEREIEGVNQIVSAAMSDVLLNYFKQLAPKIKLVSTRGKNKRLLNIEGLEYIHKHS